MKKVWLQTCNLILLFVDSSFFFILKSTTRRRKVPDVLSIQKKSELLAREARNERARSALCETNFQNSGIPLKSCSFRTAQREGAKRPIQCQFKNYGWWEVTTYRVPYCFRADPHNEAQKAEFTDGMDGSVDERGIIFFLQCASNFVGIYK